MSQSTIEVPTPPTDTVIPTDPSVRMGVLDNGLSWYVEENARPAGRADLRLVVKVGSVVEDDDQRGLAHFLEHMAFNGTEHFQGNALIDYFESIGMEFGAHLNAYTSFDETVYLLTVPTDDVALVDRGLLVLRDQAGGMLLTEEEIGRERGVVLEEWRLSLGAGQRISEQLWENAFPGLAYAERRPIGTEDSLRTFTPEALRRFYDDWYRPELMGVIAVGDFDSAHVQAEIERLFGDLENPASPRPRESVSVPPFDEPRVHVVTDKEATDVFVLLDDQFDGLEGSTWRDYRDGHLMDSLVFGIVNERLGELSLDPQGPVVGAGVGANRINATEEEVGLQMQVRGDRTLEAIALVSRELERLRRFGVTDGELARAQAAVAEGYEQYGKTAQTTPSSEHADELQRVFLSGEGMPGIALEVAMVEAWLDGISADEVSARVATLLQQGSQVAQVVVPEREGFTVPPEDAVAAALVVSADTVLEPPEDTVDDRPLVAEPPPEDAGLVVKREGPDALGITWLTLQNGVVVGIKPTDFVQDEVMLRAQSPGGLSRVDDERYWSASVATRMGRLSGLGHFEPEALAKRMAGQRAEASAGIGQTIEWVSGQSAADEVETMLQLVWLQFTAPRFTETGEARARAMLREIRARQEREPNSEFLDAYRHAVLGEGIRVDPISMAAIDTLDATVAAEVWGERFGNAADFHWMIAGDVVVEEIEPLVARWLGQLPASQAREEVDNAVVPGLLDVQHTSVVRSGDTPRAEVRVLWHGPAENTWLARNRMGALTDIVAGRLRTVLREDLGGVYGVSLSGSINPHPSPHHSVSLSFSCDPERVDELLMAAQDQFDAVVADGVTAEEVAVEQEQNRREREESTRTNGFWSSSVVAALVRGEDPAELLTWDARNDSLSSTELQALAAQVWAEDASRIEVVWQPEAP